MPRMVVMRVEIRDCTVLILLERRLIFRLLMYSRSRASSSRSSSALHLTVSMPRRLSIIWLLRIADCCMVSSLMRLNGCLKMNTSRMLSRVVKIEMEKRVAFIRKRMTPVAQAITISITTLSAMLVNTDLMVLASE